MENNFKEIVQELDTIINKINKYKEEHKDVLSHYELLKIEETAFKNILKGFENQHFILNDVLYKSNWIKSQRFDTTKFKQNQPELYQEYIVEGTTKKFNIKKLI